MYIQHRLSCNVYILSFLLSHFVARENYTHRCVPHVLQPMHTLSRKRITIADIAQLVLNSFTSDMLAIRGTSTEEG